jgi:flagellar basal-body rod modification protein FlgD
MDREPAQAKAQGSMGKDDFMKLLMTQLKYQDPLNPMDQKDFSAQLAQFSSLEQLANIGGGIQGLKSGLGDGAKLQALGMIGKHVQASGSEVELSEGHPVALKLDVSADVQPTKVEIYDGGGKLIRELALDKKAMSGEVEWDGKSADGVDAASGKYSFRVSGVDKNGQARELNPELAGTVTGVELDGHDAVLVVKTAAGSSKIEMSKVHHVTTDGAAPAQSGAATIPAPQAAPREVPVRTEGEGEERAAADESANRMNLAAQRAWSGFPDDSLSTTFSRTE